MKLGSISKSSACVAIALAAVTLAGCTQRTKIRDGAQSKALAPADLAASPGASPTPDKVIPAEEDPLLGKYVSWEREYCSLRVLRYDTSSPKGAGFRVLMQADLGKESIDGDAKFACESDERSGLCQDYKNWEKVKSQLPPGSSALWVSHLEGSETYPITKEMNEYIFEISGEHQACNLKLFVQSDGQKQSGSVQLYEIGLNEKPLIPACGSKASYRDRASQIKGQADGFCKTVLADSSESVSLGSLESLGGGRFAIRSAEKDLRVTGFQFSRIPGDALNMSIEPELAADSERACAESKYPTFCQYRHWFWSTTLFTR